MRLAGIVEKLDLEVLCGNAHLDEEVARGYASDLMSDVIANAASGDVWITLQTHLNTIAVASMKELAAIVLIQNRRPLSETLAKAKEEEVPILVSSLPAFELIGRLYALGIPGQ